MSHPTAKRNQPQQAALRATIGYVTLLGALFLFLAFGPSIGGQTNEKSNKGAIPAAFGSELENLKQPEMPSSANSSKGEKSLDEKRNSAVSVLNGS